MQSIFIELCSRTENTAVNETSYEVPAHMEFTG